MNNPMSRVEKNSLIIFKGGNKKIINFKSSIEQIEEFEKVIVVRIHPKMDFFLNENIFGISYDGEILWQIEPLKHVYKSSPYVEMIREGSNIKLCNWDGTDLMINPNSGEIVNKQYSK